MEIHALKTVLMVANQGSFAAAARVMNVDPSSVSRTVSNVEAELGLRLFQRTTRTLSATEEGEIYLRRIAPLLDELEGAQEAAVQARQAPSGTLRMTASVAFAHECIVPHLPAFHAKYPDVTVELLPTDDNLDLTAQAIDLAIRLAPAPQGDLISTRLLSTRYVVCAAPAYLDRARPVERPKDLIQHNCLRFALPGFRTAWRFREKGHPVEEVPVAGTTIISNALSLRLAAINGLGPALLAHWLVEDELDAGHLVNLFPEHECTATEFDTGAWALYPSRTYLPQKVRVMIDFLRTSLSPVNQSELTSS